MKIQLAASDAEILACFPVMRPLRELEGPEAFLAAVRAAAREGYQLAFLADGGVPIVVAGFHLGGSLGWGRYLYVHELVARPEARSRGNGAKLLSWLIEYAREQGAGQVHLESGLQRTDAHRFYRREGFRAHALHFSRVLEPAGDPRGTGGSVDRGEGTP